LYLTFVIPFSTTLLFLHERVCRKPPGSDATNNLDNL
jgi:hypothetical protein